MKRIQNAMQIAEAIYIHGINGVISFFFFCFFFQKCFVRRV